MRDAITGLIGRYDQLGRYLDRNAIDRIATCYGEAELRLAAVEIEAFNTPPAVACNEAVELANRYSDEQGRRMINGVLRRFTSAGAPQR